MAAEPHLDRRAASELQARLRSGRFVVTAEITPPVSTDPAEFLRRAMPLKGLATAVNVTDGAGAKVHLSSLATAHFLVQSGIEPIFQMTCRDRNRLALQGDLLGALTLGIHNVLVLGGDDPKAGDQPDAKPVYDLDSRALLAMFHRMRADNALPTGTKIDGPPLRLVLGAADVPLDPPPGWQPKSLQAKVAAGADFVQTQFCMDVDVVDRYLRRVRDAGITVPILIGVAPIPSARSARWMREKLFGTIIPEAHIQRLERASDAKAEGRKICIEVLRALAEIPGVAGAHVMAPMNFAEIPAVITESGVAGRKLAHAVH
ncbi:MAG TPA: methylenetetrahydrofolate reductase [Burkholderiales bacterium]|nr:methylenetetrahydrofolate reductase [Burkholderiales bacterium]